MVIKNLSDGALNFYLKIIEKNNQYFELFIDGAKVIHKTKDISTIDDALNMVTMETKELRLKMYQGESQRNDVVLFKVVSEPPSQPQPIGNIQLAPPAPTIDEKELREKFYKEFLEEYARKKEISDLKDKIANLKEQLANAKSFQTTVGTVLRTGATLAANTPSFIQKYPALSGLGKLLNGDTEEIDTEEEPSAEPKVRYNPNGGDAYDVPEEHRQALKNFLEQAKNKRELWSFVHAPTVFSQEQINDIVNFIISKHHV